jgi:hypothetical protein
VIPKDRTPNPVARLLIEHALYDTNLFTGARDSRSHHIGVEIDEALCSICWCNITERAIDNSARFRFAVSSCEPREVAKALARRKW